MLIDLTGDYSHRDPARAGSSGDPAPGGEPAAEDEPRGAPASEDPSLVRANPKRDLRAVAQSMEHQLYHHEYNPYSEGCVRGKTKDAPHFAGAFQREITHFGSVITSDICHMLDAGLGTGVGGYKWSLVVRSLHGKGFRMFYPMKRERTQDCYWAL